MGWHDSDLCRRIASHQQDGRKIARRVYAYGARIFRSTSLGFPVRQARLKLSLGRLQAHCPNSLHIGQNLGKPQISRTSELFGHAARIYNPLTQT